MTEGFKSAAGGGFCMEHYPLKVTKKARETERAFSFYLQPEEKDKALFCYRPAQFLTFKAEIEGRTVLRSYSVASCPIEEEPLRVIVARLPGGAMSNYLMDHVQEGDVLLSQIPLGGFFSPPGNLRPKEYVLLGAGIGITPLFSILKTALAAGAENKVRLIYSSKDLEHIICRSELEALQIKYSGRLFIHHVLSKKEKRLNPEKLKNLLSPVLQNEDQKKEALFYLCGPKDYMNMVQETLFRYNIAKENVRTEDFKTVPLLGPKPDEDSLILSAEPFEEGLPEKMEALLDGESAAVSMNSERSLLEQLLEGGYSPPFSCTSGSCMTCMARLKKGKIFQPETGILDEEQIKELKFLTCQAFPLSKKVVLDYDDI